nr:class II heat shock protein [Tanacetum cinerariifolium]
MASGDSDRDAEYALSKLLPVGTVAEYQNEFEILINRVTVISQSLLKSLYIFGLKLELQRELLRTRPTTLGEAFSLARITEARYEDERPAIAITKPNDLTTRVQVQDFEQTTQGQGDEPNRFCCLRFITCYTLLLWKFYIKSSLLMSAWQFLLFATTFFLQLL